MKDPDLEWQGIVDAMPNMVSIISLDHEIVRVNTAMADRVGLSAGACRGQKCFKLVHGTSEPPPFCPLQKLKVDLKPHDAEFYEPTLDCNMRVTVSPVQGKNEVTATCLHVLENRPNFESSAIEPSDDSDGAKTLHGNVTIHAENLAVTPHGDDNSVFDSLEKPPTQLDEVLAVVHVQDRAMLETGFKRAIDSGEILVVQVRVLSATGEASWVHAVARPQTRDGRVVQLFATFRDITASKHAEESAARFSRVLDDSLNEIFVFDAQSLHFVHVNRGARENLGYTLQELRELTPLDLKPDFTPELFAETIEPLQSGERDRVHFSTVHRRKDGSTYPVDVHLQQMSDSLSGPVYVAVIVDITERLRAEEIAKRSEERLQTYVAHAPAGIFVADERGRHLDVNPAGCTMTGYTEEELRELHMRDLLADPVAGDNSPGFLGEDRDGVVTAETQLRRKDGSVFDVSIASVVLPDGEYLAFCHDITERVALEEQLLQAQKMEAIGTLAGGIAHDMNNVLAVILGFGSLLEVDLQALNEDSARDVSEIVVAARRGKALVENLLGFARKGKYRKQVISLNATVIELVHMLRKTVSKQITLDVRLDDNLHAVSADATQMMQVLLNITLNAVDALEGAGEITISSQNCHFEQGHRVGDKALPAGDYVRLQIYDDGPGMDSDTRKRVFEPFFTTKEVGKGTGLGLSMVYGAVANHDGAVVIDSTLGVGTHITMILPSVGSLPSVEARGLTSANSAPNSGTVLVIDDEGLVRSMATRLLVALGYDVLAADGGAEGVSIFQEQHKDIDLVLLDLSMPRMGGAECFEKLRLIDAQVRVLICTGHSSNTATEAMITNGAVGIMKKPFDLNELSKQLRLAAGTPRAMRDTL